MSSIRKRGDTYQIRVSCGYNSQKKQIIKTMTFKPSPNMTEKQIQKELERQAVLFEEKCRTGRFLDGNIKLSEFVEKWFSDYAEKQLKAKTIARYKALVYRINPLLGHIQLDKLQPHHLIEFYNEISKNGVRDDVKYKPATDFEERMKKKNLTKKTLAQKAGVSEYVIRSCFTEKNISKKTAKKILKVLPHSLKEVKNNEPLAPKTIQHYHRFLSSVLNTAVKWQVIPYNPCSRVKPPKSEKKEAVYLDETQALALVEALKKEPVRYRTMIMLLLYSGMRRGELLGLDWDDIDFENNLINISKSSLYLPDRGIYEDTTKNKSSERIIKIPKDMIELLKNHKEEQKKMKLNCKGEWHESNKVFTALDGRPLHPDSVTGWFHRFIKKNDFPPVCVHSLRHTNATLLIAGGTDIKTVANRLGHSTPSVTGNIYAHAIKSADEAAADRLNNIFNPIKRTNKGQKENN